MHSIEQTKSYSYFHGVSFSIQRTLAICTKG